MKNFILFVFSTLSIISFSQNDSQNCQRLHSGFYSFEGNHQNIIIYREIDFQIEYNVKNQEWVVVKLTWLSNCKYTFTYFDTNMENLKQYIGDSFIVDIVASNENSYNYHSISTDSNQNEEYIGRIVRVDNLKKRKKRRIKKKLKLQKKEVE